MDCWKCGASPLSSITSSMPPSSTTNDIRILYLLKSNAEPQLDTEIPIVRDVLDMYGKSLIVLDDQIIAVHACLERLIAKRTQVEETIRQHRAALSPLRRLPRELICEILWLAAPREIDHYSRMVRRPPWHFGHICRFWREIALADGRLWNSVKFQSPPRFDVTDSSRVETQHIRSAGALLEISLDVHYDNFRVDSISTNILLSQCHRWSRLHCSSRDFPAAWLLLHPVHGRLTSLRTLELIDLSRISAAPTPGPDIFLSAPRLREVFLTDSEFRARSPSHLIHFPWNQITHYRGRYHAVRQLEILRAATNLVECGLGFDTGSSHDGTLGDQLEVVPLPSIRRLHLHMEVFTDCSSILRRLDMPALKVLYVLNSVAVLRSPESFLHRPHLTKLVLLFCPFSRELVHALKFFPSTLTHLVLDPRLENFGYDITLEVFHALTISGSPSDVCPNLTALACGYYEQVLFGHHPFAPDAQCNALFEMVQSRIQSNSHCRLSFFRWIARKLTNAKNAHEIHKRYLATLSNQGLDAAFSISSDINLLIDSMTSL